MRALEYRQLGSNCEVKEPSLSYGREDADFEIGFYVIIDVEMVEKILRDKVRTENEKNRTLPNIWKKVRKK